ncbi:MAG: hypothetical protein CMH63_02525 [Nanoarchaeota archaeon]|mgnify:CR=1 FL=1|jgi:hypothetical protein|nr:hypothetical protein [Nanoarchaeota archaeon]|tara:strand:+ start:5562 stop:6113 length:552 start_codon:yes stop_codon:yes gene_type:complete
MNLYLIILVSLILISGCGSKVVKLEKEDEVFEYKVECLEEDRNEECYDKIQEVCGWANENIKCLVYPCANNYNNGCKACSDKNVKYYTQGKCPINEDVYNGKKEGRYIEMAKGYVKSLGQYKNYNGKELRIVRIGQAECENCDFVDVEFFLDSEDKERVNKASIQVIIKNLEVVDTIYRQEKV